MASCAFHASDVTALFEEFLRTDDNEGFYGFEGMSWAIGSGSGKDLCAEEDDLDGGATSGPEVEKAALTEYLREHFRYYAIIGKFAWLRIINSR